MSVLGSPWTMQQCRSALPWILQTSEGCTHTTAMTTVHTEPGDRRQPQLQCWSFPSVQPSLGITQHFGVLLPVKNSKCLFSVRKVRFLTGVFLKTRSIARLYYFGALCHPKHVLGGSQSLPPVCAQPWLCCGQLPFPWSSEQFCVWPWWEMASIYQTKSQDSYFPCSTGITALIDPLPLRTKDFEDLSCCLLCCLRPPIC